MSRTRLFIGSLIVIALGAPAIAAEPAAASGEVPVVASVTKAPLAQWQTGTGTIAGKLATTGMTAVVGERLIAGDRPARVDLVRAPEAQVILAPGTRIRLSEQQGACLVWLDAGTVQLEVKSRGPYSQIIVVGAAMLVRVTGTLFVVERSDDGQDFVALIDGRLKVNLRDEVRRRLPASTGSEVELTSRQAIGASARGGFAAVQELPARPQIPLAPNAAGVREQAEAGLGTDWTADLGTLATTPETAPSTEAPPETLPEMTLRDEVRDQVSTVVVDSLSTTITDSVSEQVQEQVVQDAGNPELPGPPPRP